MTSTRALPTLTPTGAALTAASVVAGVLGVAFGYLTLSVIAAGGAAALAVGWSTALGTPTLEVAREIEPQRVERGRPAMGLVAVRNPGPRRTRAATATERLPDGDLTVGLPPLRPGRSTSVPYRLPTHRRGALTIGPLAIVRSDALGLWRTRRTVGAPAVLLVRPRVLPVNPRPAGRTQHVEGPTSDTAPRGTLTFHALREYVLGDDIRRVHWRTTARTGTLMVREHVDTSLPSTVIVLDTRADRYDGDRFEEAVDVAASLVAASQRRGFPVRFVTTSGVIHLVRAGQHGQDLADFLASVQPQPDGSMRHASIAALGGRDHDALLVVGGAVDRADLAAVTTMSRRFGNKGLVTVRPATGDAPVWPGGSHLDGETAASALAAWHPVGSAA